MRKLRIVGLTLILVALFIVGCSGGGNEAAGAGPNGTAATTLNLYNWTEYIDTDLYEVFEAEYGITVVEDNYGSNEDLLARLQGGATGYDVIVPSDYMVAAMIELGMVAELDKSRLENLGNLDSTFTNPPFDPNLGHCVPYFWGTTGIGFNWNDWDEAPDSWDYIFNPEKAAEFSGTLSMLNDQREVIGAALIYLGYSPNSTVESELEEAKDVILAVKPFIASFDSETYEDNMVAGEILLAHGWSGDFFAAQVEDENIDYAIPQEGAIIWMDNLCITVDAAADPARLEAAYLWIDFLNRPEIAGQNTNFVWYGSPNEAALEFIDEEILGYEAIYPPPEVFEKLIWLENLGDATAMWSRIWTEISTG